MQFSDIKDNKLKKQLENVPNIIFNDITDNIKKIKKGDIFVALKGEKFNGEDNIDLAIQAGVVACIASKSYSKDLYYSILKKYDISESFIPLICIDNVRDFLSRALFDIYSQYIPKNIITVTGTNGKSSVTYFISQILDHLNHRNILIGTLGVFLGDEFLQSSLTTPNVHDLIEIFKKAKAKSVDTIIVENSSHGIEQSRMSGLFFNSIGFTNLSQDHLDYHKTIDEYFKVKSSIFNKDYTNNVVININDEYGKTIINNAKNTKVNIITYGFAENYNPDITLRIKETIDKNDYQLLIFYFNNKRYQVKVNVIGVFQIYNLMCAIGQVLQLGYNIEEIIDIIPNLKAVNGRMDQIEYDKIDIHGKIVIDYAHTPIGLENALSSLRRYVKPNGKLIVLFGCGGNRDQSKRSQMGDIASRLADVIYITDDNPRYEDPYTIRAHIKQGIDKSRNTDVYNISDRQKAIKLAIQYMKKEDVLLIAGKGHEVIQHIRGYELPFNDKQVVLQVLNEVSNKC